ncbi:MAG: hypothetical protein D6714_19455, partial [Bacteroidetes bacterium]
MRRKDDLFRLINAMSKSEKRYFTLDAQKSGKEGAKYLRLFRLINKMEVYDEALLQAHFPKSLPTDKRYLYEAILRSMRDYRSAKSRAAQIKERILDSRYLYERGLYKQFDDRLKEARQIALELDDHFSLLEIIRETLLAKQNLTIYKRTSLDDLRQMSQKKEASLQAVLDELRYLDLYVQLFGEIIREFVLREEAQKQALSQRMPPEIFDPEYVPPSASAELRLLKCRAFFFQLTGADDEVFLNWRAVLDWWEKHPKIKEEHFFRYIIDVSNLLNTCFKIKKYESHIPPLLARLEKEKPRSKHDGRVLFQKLTISKLLYFINNGDLETAKMLLPGIEKGLKKHQLGNDLVIVGNVVFLLFMTGDFAQCLEWSRKIIGRKSEKREDIQRIIRIFNLISLYE